MNKFIITVRNFLPTLTLLLTVLFAGPLHAQTNLPSGGTLNTSGSIIWSQTVTFGPGAVWTHNGTITCQGGSIIAEGAPFGEALNR